MRHSRSRLGVLVATVLCLGACATGAPAPTGPELRVAVTTTYPPIIFRAGGPTTGQVTGVEAELAYRIGEALGRAVRFVEVRWEEQIPMLVAGRTDIIMSGMSITPARQVRISFTEPYLETGLAVAMRTENAARYASKEQILTRPATVGVIEGTTADVFAQRSLPNARRIAYARASDAAIELKRGTIDLFLHDAPSIMWLVSENEAALTWSSELLTKEQLAWGLRRDDANFLNWLNDLLARWKADGSLEAVLQKWLPYRRQSKP
jgi:ABC-type amino acid transport substrate-binding protein